MTLIEAPPEIPPGYRSRMTEAQFESWALATRTQAEWVEGEVILMSPVNIEHSDIVGWLHILLGLFVSRNRLGKVVATEVMVRLPDRRRLPDVFYVSNDRIGKFSRTFMEGAPNLVIEVVSSDSTDRDYQEKFSEYQIAGVNEYWIIDPLAKRALFYALRDGKYAILPTTESGLHSLALPGFHFKPEWLFQSPLPEAYDTAKLLGII